MTTKHITRQVSRELRGAASLRPGWALVLEVSSRGGIEYTPAIVKQTDNTRIETSSMIIDDNDLERMVRSLRNQTRKLVQKYATHTDIGVWFIGESALDKLEQEIQEYRKALVQINERSIALGSVRQTRCEYFVFPWDYRDPKLRARVGQLIHSRMSDLKEAYTESYKDRYRIEMTKCENLDLLVKEPQASLVRNALNATRQQRHSIIRHYGGSNVPMELLKLRSDEIQFDYGPIDLAIAEFEPMKDAFILEYPATSKAHGRYQLV